MNYTNRYELRRTFAAPAEDVFRYFVEPEAFSRRFVVPGFTTPPATITMDPRPGGSIEAVMIAQDGGAEIPFSIRFGDLRPSRRIVIYPGSDEQVTVTLSPATAGTELLYSYEGPAAAPADIAAVETMLDHISHHLSADRS